MSGRVKLHVVENGIWTPASEWRSNECTRESGVVSFEALLRHDKRYVLNAMYFEFENVVSSGDNVDVSGIDKSEGLSYYNGLSGSSVKDFLRLPLTSGVRPEVGEGYETDLEDGQYNRGIVYAQSSGTAGVFGRSFAAGSNSKIYGVALVCAPVWGDRTKDVVYARAYYEGAEQMLKLASRQAGISYDVLFNHDE